MRKLTAIARKTLLTELPEREYYLDKIYFTQSRISIDICRSKTQSKSFEFVFNLSKRDSRSPQQQLTDRLNEWIEWFKE